jgi:hypothetical protein
MGWEGSLTDLRDMEVKVKRIWASLAPALDETEKRILINYLVREEAATPYSIARETEFSIATVYRKVKKLTEKHVIMPIDDRGKLALTIKGCITLFVNNLIDLASFVKCAERAWDMKLSARELLGFLYLLGIEATRRSLSLRDFTMCRMDEASVHVIRLLKNTILKYIFEGSDFANVLKELASELEIPLDFLREGLRLALRGIARTLPIILHTEHHKAALFVHGKLLLPFAVECRRNCHHFRTNLGFDCPTLAEEVRRYLAVITGLTPYTVVQQSSMDQGTSRASPAATAN